jgi:putative ABC transport system permease protein
VNAFELLRFATRSLTANKMRSALTVLGILIGVSAVILLVAIGEGASRMITENIQQLGANTLTIYPDTMGGGGGGRRQALMPGEDTGPRTQAKDLTVADARALADKTGAPSVKTVSPVVDAQGQTAVYEGVSHPIMQFVGTYPSYFAASNKQVDRGSYFTNDDVLAARKIVVIGQTVADNLFGRADPVGKRITIGGVPFAVAGVLKTTGSTGGFQDADDMAIAPLPAVQQSLTGFGPLGQIIVQATSAGSVYTAESEVTSILNQRHGITGAAADFRVLNQATLQETVELATSTFTYLLAAIAGISLLVGGIGITNIMLVTVTERTREIGIRKAVGAPRSAILGQFLAEATMLSLLGGLLGVAVGVAFAQISVAGLTPVVQSGSIVLALSVSVGIGLFFGGYPAARAAKLRPIEALRHE